jgi:hypothetical protein
MALWIQYLARAIARTQNPLHGVESEQLYPSWVVILWYYGIHYMELKDWTSSSLCTLGVV